MTIHNPQHPNLNQVTLLRTRRGRDRSGRFVAEGEDLIAAAAANGWQPVDSFVAEGSGLSGTEVSEEALAEVSALGSGTRALAIYEQRWSEPTGPLAVWLHGVGDPGNVGTIIRSAHAFGASSVILGPGSADPFGPKAVRASMGAIFSVAVARADELEQLPGTTVALAASAPVELDGAPWPEGELTLLIGAEREGLPEAIVAAAGEARSIAIDGDSLNAAMAATIALYSCTRKV
ncbi:MAG: RNA methyltransferase [Actinomycetes bacterium]